MEKYIPYIKTIFIAFLLFIESYFLTTMILTFVRTKNILIPQQTMLILIGFVMLLTMYTIAMTIGAWNKWQQYLIVPIPIVLGIFLVMMNLNVLYAGIVAINVYILLAYEVYISTSMIKILLKFHPVFVFRSMMRMTFLFIFGVVAAVLMILVNSTTTIDINVGKLVSDYAGDPIERYITGQFNQAGVPQEMLGFIGVDVKQTIETEVNDAVTPYKQFIIPIMAVLALGWIQFTAILALTVYGISISLLLNLAKKTKLLIVENVQVEQEHLKF